MDPLTTATTFAALVGLICNFRQERGSRKALDHKNFIEWLEHHRHEELKNLIASTAALQVEINDFLNSSALLSRQNTNLSEQAISILSQFVNSGTTSFFYEDLGSSGFSLGWKVGNEIEITEPRLLEDDLGKLVQLGLLLVDHAAGRNRTVYRLTRNAVKFLGAFEKRI